MPAKRDAFILKKIPETKQPPEWEALLESFGEGEIAPIRGSFDVDNIPSHDELPSARLERQCECPPNDPALLCVDCYLDKASRLGTSPPGRDSDFVTQFNSFPYALKLRALGDKRAFQVHFTNKKDCDAACQAAVDLKNPLLGEKNVFLAYKKWRIVNWTVFGRRPDQEGLCRLDPLDATEVRKELPRLALSAQRIRRYLQPFRPRITEVLATFGKGHILPADRARAQSYRAAITLDSWKRRLRIP